MTSMERYTPALALWFACLALMAMDFGVVVLRGGSPITAEIYGPSVYAFPAMAWVAVQFFIAATGVLGLAFKGKLRATLFAVSGFGLGILFAVFVFMAGQAPAGSVLESSSRFVAAPISFMAAIISVGHFYGR